MDFFKYKENTLYAEDVSLEQVAEKVGTPCFVYSMAAFMESLSALEAAFQGVRHLICYSVKAASNLTLLSLVAEKGMGADIVSGGELFRALKSGISPRRIVYSGVGKSREELEAALAAEIFMFNLESADEMGVLAEIAQEREKVAQIAFRVNPDVDPQTHPYIATGLKETKFGVSREEALKLYAEARKNPWFKVIGIDCHIGSQLTELLPFKDSMEILADLVKELRREGHSIRYLDIGGGLGIRYNDEEPPTVQEYAQTIIKATSGIQDLTLVLEPGRSVVGNSCVLLSKVLYNKKTPLKRFVIVDAAMNDLIRPSLYGSYHQILPLKQNANVTISKAQVVGPVCESGDFLAKDRMLPQMHKGAYVAVCGAGAYGFSMSSNYNSRPRAAEVMVYGSNYQVIRERESYEDLIRGEHLSQLNKI
ncbi:MAG: diaminopimelate decarboxylase [Deltaproteobacteria bacterium]|jgi:diaminopimelate decarboxylase|nr:diaminopimelate decarboxylase [Deltaproteobacteria bacterium]